MDPGHPVIFPLMHALLWKIFGAHLWVSHLFNLTFVLLALYFSFQLDRYYKCRLWLMLLIAINPLFIAIAATLNTHMALTAFFLGFHYYQSKSNLGGQLLCLSALLLTHNQGMLLAFVLLIADFIVYRNPKQVLKLLPSLIPWSIWLIIHKSQTGWYLFPPEYAQFRGVGSTKNLIKNAAIIAWRLFDFGLLSIWILATPFLLKNRDKKYVQIALIALGVIGSVWLSVKFSIAHRYIIFAILILSIPAAVKLKHHKTGIKLLVMAILFSGSFWYYPGKQLSDANMQYRSFFSIYRTIQNQNSLRNRKIFSTPPNESHSGITHLSHDSMLLNIASLSEELSKNRITLVMNGNVCGPLPDEIKELISTWNTITIQSGTAWVNLHSKTPFNKELLQKFPKRTPTWLESKLISLKRKLK